MRVHVKLFETVFVVSVKNNLAPWRGKVNRLYAAFDLICRWYVNQICLHWHWLIVLNVMKVLTHVISFHLILSFGLIFNDGTVESTFYHEILWLKWNILYSIVIFKMIKITLIWLLILVISCGTFIFSPILTAVTKNLDGWGSVRRRYVDMDFTL